MRSLALLLSLCIAACNTGPDESLRTVLVSFDAPVTDADISALRAVGGSIQHRFDLARAVSLRTGTPAADYRSVAGVRSADDLGESDDPMVSVFVETDGPPVAADSTFIASLDAEFIFMVPEDQVIAVVMPLGRVEDLESRSRFIAIGVYPEEPRTQ